MGCGCSGKKAAPPPPVVEEPTIVETTLEIKATAALEESVKEDLEKEDPTEEVAKAVLNNGGIGGF